MLMAGSTRRRVDSVLVKIKVRGWCARRRKRREEIWTGKKIKREGGEEESPARTERRRRRRDRERTRDKRTATAGPVAHKLQRGRLVGAQHAVCGTLSHVARPKRSTASIHLPTDVLSQPLPGHSTASRPGLRSPAASLAFRSPPGPSRLLLSLSLSQASASLRARTARRPQAYQSPPPPTPLHLSRVLPPAIRMNQPPAHPTTCDTLPSHEHK